MKDTEIKSKGDIKDLTCGKEIMGALSSDLLKASDVDTRIRLANVMINIIQTGVNKTRMDHDKEMDKRKMDLEERKQTLAERKFNKELMEMRPALEKFEKENNLSPVFSAPQKEEERLSLYEIRQQIDQWRKDNPGIIPDDQIPNGHQLENAGPQYVPLIESIYDHGGFKEVAEKLGLKFT